MTLFVQWYAFLGQANNFLSPYLSGLSRQIHIPVLSALLLGLLGSTSPCQLSTNFSALGLFHPKNQQQERVFISSLFIYPRKSNCLHVNRFTDDLIGN